MNHASERSQRGSSRKIALFKVNQHAETPVPMFPSITDFAFPNNPLSDSLTDWIVNKMCLTRALTVGRPSWTGRQHWHGTHTRSPMGR